MGDGDAMIHSACFSKDDKYIAASKNNGEIDIFNLATKKRKYTIRNPKGKVPFTMVKWREHNESFLTNNVIGSVNSDGQIQHWHVATGKRGD
jgi:COMPASS component SWD3